MEDIIAPGISSVNIPQTALEKSIPACTTALRRVAWAIFSRAIASVTAFRVALGRVCVRYILLVL